jgi:hypothetical protein
MDEDEWNKKSSGEKRKRELISERRKNFWGEQMKAIKV